MSRLAADDDDFVCTETTLKEQVGFCLIGGFGITAEMNHAVFDRLLEQGIFLAGRIPTAVEIEALLLEPVLTLHPLPPNRSRRLRALRLYFLWSRSLSLLVRLSRSVARRKTGRKKRLRSRRFR